MTRVCVIDTSPALTRSTATDELVYNAVEQVAIRPAGLFELVENRRDNPASVGFKHNPVVRNAGCAGADKIAHGLAGVHMVCVCEGMQNVAILICEGEALSFVVGRRFGHLLLLSTG